MNIKEFQRKSDIISTKLKKGELADALSLTSRLMEQEGIVNYKDKLNQIKQTYKYLLHYFAEGAADDSRPIMFKSLSNSLRDLLQRLIIEKKMAESSELFFSTSRICRHRNLSFEDQLNKIEDITTNIMLGESAGIDTREMRAEKDNLMRELFDYLWTSFISKETARQMVGRILDMKDYALGGYIIAALTMSLLTVYDRNKLDVLLDVYEKTDSDTLSARSLVGIVLTIDKYRDLIMEDNDLKTRLELWSDSILTYSRLRGVIKELIKARDTDRLTAKMRDEVIPELMKMRPDIMKKMRKASEDPESLSLEGNPEWEKMLEKSGIADKLREFTEMQMEGADMMMVSFANLKGFPFFRNINSWFLPFTADHPAIIMDSNTVRALESVLGINKLVCDSDKYSLFLAFATMPEQQRNMMFGQFEAQMNQMMEELKEKRSKESNADFIGEAVLFIRDLYRFFRLFSKKNEFYDPFGHPFNFIALPYLNNMLMDEDMITVIGEFYYKRGYYPEAIALLSMLEKSKGLEYEYWEKIGFINHKLGNNQDALDSYQKAELLGDSGFWLMRNLAAVNEHIGNYRAAAHYYESILEKDPENLSILKNIAYCQTRIGDYAAALKYYYHADYISPDNIDIRRQIAWSELMMGNLDKSESFYVRIPESDRSSTDYLNMGHLYLVKGNIQGAIESYRYSYNRAKDQFTISFNADRAILDKLGVDRLTQQLIIDSIKMAESED